ncbi:hypothetical protein DFH05DRAFT_1524147 [Lentinula detonsa]|uniref:Uncharacterized protein n=1 Tax=Lentinula detonsa TaxID=2804962 RepID=A0A9W8P352_9AGAR|nr:hypothetical protein DFH05DRAFT_1524147 [Lentinula detonsa]
MNSSEAQHAYHDPSVLLYTEKEFFALLESNNQVAQLHSSSESRLYPPLSRIAWFGHKRMSTFRLPDCAGCIYDRCRLLVAPAFLMEAKRLGPTRGHDWCTATGAHVKASRHFIKALPQVRDQVQHAFDSFAEGPDHNYVFIHVGIFWSLLLFKKEDEKAIREIEIIEKQRILGPSSAKSRLKKRSRLSSSSDGSPGPKTPPRPSNLSPSAAATPFVSPVSSSDSPIPDELLPEVIFFNQPLVTGLPATVYSPPFRQALSIVMDAAGFSLQPTWLTAPQYFDFAPYEKKRGDGKVALRKAYFKDKIEHYQDYLKHQLNEEPSPPDNKQNDPTYAQPRHTYQPRHTPAKTRAGLRNIYDRKRESVSPSPASRSVSAQSRQNTSSRVALSREASRSSHATSRRSRSRSQQASGGGSPSLAQSVSGGEGEADWVEDDDDSNQSIGYGSGQSESDPSLHESLGSNEDSEDERGRSVFLEDFPSAPPSSSGDDLGVVDDDD